MRPPRLSPARHDRCGTGVGTAGRRPRAADERRSRGRVRARRPARAPGLVPAETVPRRHLPRPRLLAGEGVVSDRGRLILADDHALFREGLRQLLEAEGYAIAAEAASGQEALSAVATHPGCVLLLDIGMPGTNGLEVARRLCERGDDVKVVMLSAREDRDALFSAISAGARGYVAKDAETGPALRRHRPRDPGGTVLSTGVAANLGEGIRQLDYVPGAYEQRRLELTDRELEILRLLATPRSPAQIASELYPEQEDGAEPRLRDLSQAWRGQPLRGHPQGHGAAPHRLSGLGPATSPGSIPAALGQAFPIARGKPLDDALGEGRDRGGPCADAARALVQAHRRPAGLSSAIGPSTRRRPSSHARTSFCLAWPSGAGAGAAPHRARPGHVRARTRPASGAPAARDDRGAAQPRAGPPSRRAVKRATGRLRLRFAQDG